MDQIRRQSGVTIQTYGISRILRRVGCTASFFRTPNSKVLGYCSGYKKRFYECIAPTQTPTYIRVSPLPANFLKLFHVTTLSPLITNTHLPIYQAFYYWF
jgi:hypothetical protein